MIGKKHANFLLNVAGATASELRSLAEYAKREVKAKFEVDLEEEVMYIGDWTNFQPISP
jgi:UDP-N-acetylmuramate dehydrogenase